MKNINVTKKITARVESKFFQGIKFTDNLSCYFFEECFNSGMISIETFFLSRKEMSEDMQEGGK